MKQSHKGCKDSPKKLQEKSENYFRTKDFKTQTNKTQHHKSSADISMHIHLKIITDVQIFCCIYSHCCIRSHDKQL